MRGEGDRDTGGDMTGADIAARFEIANVGAADYIEGPAAAHWQTPTPEEGWPVGVTARHIGLGHDLMAGWARGIKTGGPFSGFDVHDRNAEVAAAGIVADPAEVAELLRANGAHVIEALRALDDADLEGEVDFGGRRLPATMLAEAAIRHVESHLGSIRAAVEGASG
jgi:hypothetical protein